MATNYIETFKIPGVSTMGIENVGDGYQVWAGGCGIGKFDSLQNARARIFNYLKNEIDGKLNSAKRDLSFYQPIQDGLGNDVFNLGKYKE